MAATPDWLNRRSLLDSKLKEGELASILLKNNELHIEIQIDRNHPIGKLHPAGVKDVILEAAVTTIQDCEDSVAAVDAADKVRVYRSWNGIMRGTLEATFERNGRRDNAAAQFRQNFYGSRRSNDHIAGKKLVAGS